MTTNIYNNKVSIQNCHIKDIINAIKGLQLLNKSISEIEVKANFDFDTKYYYKFTEEKINTIYKKTRSTIFVILKNNRLYYNDIILPMVDNFECVYIYFD